MIVKNQKPINFLNVCDCLVDYEELEKAILWYTDKPVTSKKKIFIYGKYPAVAIHKEKIHIHRLLMMFWENRKLERWEYVHHKDENKLNAIRDNLEIKEATIHQSMHNKGRIFSQEHRNKIALANSKRKIKYKKRIQIPLDELRVFLENSNSISYIAKKYDCSWDTVKERIKENSELLKLYNNKKQKSY